MPRQFLYSLPFLTLTTTNTDVMIIKTYVYIYLICIYYILNFLQFSSLVHVKSLNWIKNLINKAIFKSEINIER